MRHSAFALVLTLGLTAALGAQPPAARSGVTPGTAVAATQPPGAAQRPTPQQQRRRGAQVMEFRSPAFPEGGAIPVKHSQAGAKLSPPLEWSNVPDGTQSFVLIVHDPHTAVQSGPDTLLHWMVWNIPATARALPEGVPHADELPDGSRQISVSGPYYRGPGAPASGPVRHYVFELFALDTTIDVPAIGQSPAATRAAVVAAMQGHVLGKGAYVGTFRR